jgi:hypothetical protein
MMSGRPGIEARAAENGSPRDSSEAARAASTSTAQTSADWQFSKRIEIIWQSFKSSKINRKSLSVYSENQHMPSGLVRRARAVLLASEGKSLTETGRIVGMGRLIVRRWVSRFIVKRIEGLKDKPGRGRKPSFPPGGCNASGEAGM